MILDTSFPPDPRVENEAVSLIKAGHEVHLFSLCYENRKKFEVINGIKVHRYKGNKLTYKLSALAYTIPFYEWLVIPKLKKFISKNRIEVLHVHDMLIAQAVMRANKSFRLKIVLDLHENRPEIMRDYVHLNKFPGNILISLNKWKRKQNELIEKADKLILVTKEAKQVSLKVVDKLCDKDVIVVPNTVILRIFNNYEIEKRVIEKYDNHFVVLYVGDTSLRRGTDTAIEAVELLKSKIPDIKLVMVGKSAEDKKLKQLIAKLNLEAFVSMVGWQDLSLFPSYIMASDVCISPLKRNLHHDTTYANKIFQYMALGKSLIVSNCPSQENIVNEENCGLVFEAENTQDLAAQILKLYNSSEQKSIFEKNAARAVKERYNWGMTSKPLVEFYDKV